MMNSAYEVPPDGSANAALQEALRQLAVLNAENTRLRQQMFDANEKYDDMSMCHRVTEIELKHAMKKDAEIFEKELSIRNRDLASLNRDHSGILKQLATLKQQQFLQQKQQQLLMKKQILNNDNGTDTSNSSGRFNLSQGSITNGSYGPYQTIDVPKNNSNHQSQSLSVNSNLSLSLSSQSINSKSGIHSKGSNGSISNNNINYNRISSNSINNNGNGNNNNNNNSNNISNNSSNNNNNIHDKHGAYANSSTASIRDVTSFTGHEAASVQSEKAVNLLVTTASTVTASDRYDKKHIASVNIPDPIASVTVAALGVSIAASNTSTTVVSAATTATTTAAATITAASSSSSSAPVLKAICSEVMDDDMKPATSGVGLAKPIVAPVLISDVRDAVPGPLGTSDVLDDLRDDVTYMSTLLPLYQDLLKSTTLLLACSSSFSAACENKSIGSLSNEKSSTSWNEVGKHEFNVSNERLDLRRNESFGDSNSDNNSSSSSSNSSNSSSSTLSHLIDRVQNAFNSFLQNQSTIYSGFELFPLGDCNTSEQKALGGSSLTFMMASSVCALARCLLAMSVRRCYSARTNDNRIYRNNGEDYNVRSRTFNGISTHGIGEIHGRDKETERNIGKNYGVANDDRGYQPEQESLSLSLKLLEFIIEHFRKDEIAQTKKARKQLLSSQVLVKSEDQDMRENVSSSSLSNFIQHQNKDKDKHRSRSGDSNGDSEATMDLNSKFENVAGTNHAEGSLHSAHVTTENEGKTLQKRKSISKFNGNGSGTVCTSKDNLNSPGPVLMSTIIKERNVTVAVAGHRGLAVTRGLSGSGKKSSVSFAERGHITPVTGTHTHTGYGEDGRRGSIDGDSAPPSTSTAHDVGSSVSCKRPRLLGPKHAVSVTTGLSYFPLSSLVMPGVSGDVLKLFYDDAAAANRIENLYHKPNIEDQRAFYPLKRPKLPGVHDAVGRLPGDLVELMGDLALLLNILTTPSAALPYTPHYIQHDKHDTVWNQSSSSRTYDQNRYRLSLLDAAVSLLSRMFKGDISASSICSGDDLIPLFGPRSVPSILPLYDNTVEGRNTCSLLSLFSFSSTSSSSSSSSTSVLNLRNNVYVQDGDDDEENNYSDALQLLERNAFCEINAELSEHEKHQLTSESSLLLILLEFLKNKKAFKCFLICQNKLNSSIHTHAPMYVDRKQPQSYTGYTGYNGRRLISHLCRRLLLNVSDSDSDSHGGKSSGESGRRHTECVTFSMTTIKLKIVYFITGIVETYGKDGVAAVFGVAALPVSLVLSMGDMGGRLREGGHKAAGVGTRSGSGSGSGPSFNRRIGSQDLVDSGIGLRSVRECEDITRVDNTAVHCLCVCWTLSTRSLHLAPHTLSPEDRLTAELVDAIGRVLDLMAGQMTPKEWSYLITLKGDVDDEMISRQMSQRALCSVHPVLLRMCKDNPLGNLW